MGFNSYGAGSQDERPEQNAQFFIFNTIFKLRDAHADGEIEKAWRYMQHGLELLVAYLSMEERQAVDGDLRKIREYFTTIDKRENTSDVSKEKETLKLKQKFIEEHMYYIYIALPRAKFLRVEQEGELPIDKLELDTIAKIISSGANTITKAEDLDKKGKLDKIGGVEEGENNI